LGLRPNGRLDLELRKREIDFLEIMSKAATASEKQWKWLDDLNARRKGSSMKSSDDLPDDEGTMFIAWSPNANFAVSGRRGRDGELYVGSIYRDASMSTLKGVKHSIEQIKSTGVDVELVTGAEADKLFTEMAQRLQSSGAER
jgi:hypothetical protein